MHTTVIRFTTIFLKTLISCKFRTLLALQQGELPDVRPVCSGTPWYRTSEIRSL